MSSKPDKESEKHGDMILLSEIIANFIYWQEIWAFRKGSNYG